MDSKKVAPLKLCIATDIRLEIEKWNKRPLNCYLFDLEKAFDSIYHDIKLCCLLQRSIRRRTIPFTENLLKTKEATIRVIDILETTFDPSIGVPDVMFYRFCFSSFFWRVPLKNTKRNKLKKTADDNSNFCRPSELTQSFDAPQEFRRNVDLWIRIPKLKRFCLMYRIQLINSKLLALSNFQWIDWIETWNWRTALTSWKLQMSSQGALSNAYWNNQSIQVLDWNYSRYVFDQH